MTDSVGSGEVPLFINSVGGIGSPFWTTKINTEFLPKGLGYALESCAVLESIVFLLIANLKKLQQSNPDIRAIKISGGVAQLAGFCKRLAALAGMAVTRQGIKEATLYGAARLASGLSLRILLPQDSEIFNETIDTFPGLQQRYYDFMAYLEASV